ncbi:MAG TPA: YihY/virulence factor BrkB family protein [Planctomycetaceae bacterium]
MVSFLKQTFSEFSEDACMRMAAALSYYTAFALPPLFVILLMVLGMYYRATGQGGEEAAREQMNRQIEILVGPAASDEVREMIKSAGLEKGSLWRWALSLAGVLIGATGLVAALQDTLNEAWEVKPDPAQGGIKNFLFKRIFSLGMILGVAFLLLVSTILTYWIGGIVGPASAVLAAVVSFLVVTVLFAAMFKYLPDAEIRWKDVIVGAVVTAALFTAGKYGLSMYLSQGKFQSQFGAAASLALLLAWVYYSSLILLYGAEFTQVWAKRFGHGIQPEPGAVRVVTETKKVPHDA